MPKWNAMKQSWCCQGWVRDHDSGGDLVDAAKITTNLFWNECTVTFLAIYANLMKL